MNRVLLVGGSADWSLEATYRRAFDAIGWEVIPFDLKSVLAGYTRLGWVGRTVTRFVPVEPWVQKANRSLLLAALETDPDLLLVVGTQPVRVGALAQFKAVRSGATAFVWPDSMLNVTTTMRSYLSLFDVVGTYSERSVPMMEALGARKAIWLPLAGDPQLHGPDAGPPVDRSFDADVSFVGAWRPEREAVLERLTGYDLKIWGPGWGRRCKGNEPIMRAWQGRPLYGAEFAAAVRASKINLNIIDPTNHPAANMRFFEIPVAGGLQVSSACPEMSHIYEDGRHLFYYESPDDLAGLIGRLLTDEGLRADTAAAGHALTLDHHTYTRRASALVDALGGSDVRLDRAARTVP